MYCTFESESECQWSAANEAASASPPLDARVRRVACAFGRGGVVIAACDGHEVKGHRHGGGELRRALLVERHARHQVERHPPRVPSQVVLAQQTLVVAVRALRVARAIDSALLVAQF